MNNVPHDMQQLFETAMDYVHKGEHYHAVKLFKKIIKKEKEWVAPYFELSKIYKKHQDWKGTYHYSKKTVSLDSANKEAWWNLGIAATANGRSRIARNIWSKFGQHPFQERAVCVRLQRDNQFEIIWGLQLDPTRVQIYSIPHPKSDRTYKDLILIDKHIIGHTVVKNKKQAVFQELDLLKRSVYQTYTCWLYSSKESDIYILEKLCQDAGIGFEVWSNAVRLKSLAKADELPEYFTADMLPKDEDAEGVQVAFGAKLPNQIHEVLEQWKVITLSSCSELIAL
ncbi:MAG: hypothetical protein MK226_20065 [Saprospiraceae bacterium]|nr:hypothetical protein [Saprospiraceae bacterium]